MHHNNAATPCMGPSLRHAWANLCKLEIRPRLVCSLLSAKCWQNKCSLGTETLSEARTQLSKRLLILTSASCLEAVNMQCSSSTLHEYCTVCVPLFYRA